MEGSDQRVHGDERSPLGNSGAAEGSTHASVLVTLLHAELRELAARSMRGEGPGCSLQPTALVNEAFLRLHDQRNLADMSREEFFGAAATVMRRILVDHARGRDRAKRGRGWTRVLLDSAEFPTPQGDVDILALNEAMETLARRSPRQARIVELRFFGGLDMTEVAAVVGLSRQTAQEEWRFARAWLAATLGPG